MFLMAQIIAAGCMICACGAGPDETEKASNTEFVSKGYTVESDTMVTESTENTEKTTFSNAALGDVKEQTVKISKTSVIYSKPDANASQLGSIEKGTKVKALGDVDTNGWVMVEYNGRAAYIQAESAGITLSASDTDTDSADESDNDSTSDKKKRQHLIQRAIQIQRVVRRHRIRLVVQHLGLHSRRLNRLQHHRLHHQSRQQRHRHHRLRHLIRSRNQPRHLIQNQPTPTPDPEPEPTPTPDPEPEQSSEQSSEQIPAE